MVKHFPVSPTKCLCGDLFADSAEHRKHFRAFGFAVAMGQWGWRNNTSPTVPGHRIIRVPEALDYRFVRVYCSCGYWHQRYSKGSRAARSPRDARQHLQQVADRVIGLAEKKEVSP